MSQFLRHLALASCLMSALFPAFAARPYPNTGNFGVPFSKDEPWYQQCMRVAAQTAPDASTASTASPTCKASDLYYSKRDQAATSPVEWNTVRQCALAHQDSAVLMMLYANGFGVPRNADIAMHYACDLEFIAKAEMDARVGHLSAAPRPGAVFDQCDDITSGYMGAVCAEIQERQAKRVRGARLDRMARGLSDHAKSAFNKLLVAAERYTNAASAETDMRGTGAAGFQLQRLGRLREQFMQAAFDTENGRLPPSSPMQFLQRDSELNATYQALMDAASKQDESPDRIGDSTIRRADIRNTERLWIAYRDAFVAFRAQLSSGSDANAIKTLLTIQRRADLEEIGRYR